MNYMSGFKNAGAGLLVALSALAFTAPAFADRGHGGHGGHGGHIGHGGHWGHGHGWHGGPRVGFGIYTGPDYYSYDDDDDDDCYRVYRRGAWRIRCD